MAHSNPKPKLSVTKNYSLFELLDFNRDVRKIKNLKLSMKKHGYIPAWPIHVVRNYNGKLKIKAGHHRFIVACELSLPLYYVVCEDTATIHELEAATNKWTLRDYLVSFCHCEVPAYLQVAEYAERTGIGLQAAISMFAGQSAGSGNSAESFKSGTYKIVDTTHPETVAKIVMHCAGAGLKFARVKLFIAAISRMVRVPEFDVVQFLRRVTVNATLCERQPHLAGYLEMIEMIYNRGSRDKVPLVFMSKQVMRDRISKYFGQKAK